MEIAIILSFSICFIISGCSRKIYEAPTFTASKDQIKHIAILPFSMAFDEHVYSKDFSSKTEKEMQIKAGYAMQKNVYAWFDLYSKKYFVSFQDFEQTNSILNSKHIGYDSVLKMDAKALSILLGVDAVFIGKGKMLQPVSNGIARPVAYATGLFLTTSITKVTVFIYDAFNQLQWKCDAINKGIGSNRQQDLTNRLMKSISKKFPYAINNNEEY